MATTAKKTKQKLNFKPKEHIVYPSHGVGQIMAVQEQQVAGYKLEVLVIDFPKDKMTLRVPIGKIESVGMRKLSNPELVEKAFTTVAGRPRVKRTMWSRRAQEYEAKINSGDLIAITEVVRDLHRADHQPEQSYSERQLYEAALDRMAREIAACKKISDSEATREIETTLATSSQRAARPSEDTLNEECDEAA